MAGLEPSDDAIVIAAANLTAAYAGIRAEQNGPNPDADWLAGAYNDSLKAIAVALGRVA